MTKDELVDALRSELGTKYRILTDEGVVKVIDQTGTETRLLASISANEVVINPNDHYGGIIFATIMDFAKRYVLDRLR